MFVGQLPRPAVPLDVDTNNLGRAVFGHSNRLVPPTRNRSLLAHKTAAEVRDGQGQELERVIRRWFL